MEPGLCQNVWRFRLRALRRLRFTRISPAILSAKFASAWNQSVITVTDARCPSNTVPLGVIIPRSHLRGCSKCNETYYRCFFFYMQQLYRPAANEFGGLRHVTPPSNIYFPWGFSNEWNSCSCFIRIWMCGHPASNFTVYNSEPGSLINSISFFIHQGVSRTATASPGFFYFNFTSSFFSSLPSQFCS